MLREVVRHAGDIYQDAAEWLRRVNRSTMFAGKPLITLMVAEGRGDRGRAAPPEQDDLQWVGAGQAAAAVAEPAAVSYVID